MTITDFIAGILKFSLDFGNFHISLGGLVGFSFISLILAWILKHRS